MKYQSLLFLLLTVCISCSKDTQISKKQSEEFIKFFGSAGMDSSAQILPVSGGYLMLASERTSAGFQACIYKTDMNGNPLFRSVLSDTVSFVASSIVVSSDGGYWVCGNTSQLIDSAAKLYESNIVLAKLSPEFKTTSVSIYPIRDVVVAAITVDTQGAVYIAGSHQNESGQPSIVCVKILDQKLVWRELKSGKIYGVPSGITFYEGSLFIVGSSDFYIEYGQEKNNILLLNVNTSGQILDRITYGGTGNDYGYGIAACDGKLYVSGSIFSDNDYSDGWLACFDKDIHHPVWTTTTHARGYDELLSVCVSESGIVSSGFIMDESLRTKNIYLTRFSLEGELLQQFVSGGNDNEIARSVIMAEDGQPVVTGTMYADADAVIFMLKTKL